MSVFFRKLRVNDSTGTATIIVTDITFGVLSLIDPETNQVMKANHPTIKALQGKLNAGDEMKGFQLSDNPVIDLNTGEETNLRWVEQA